MEGALRGPGRLGSPLLSRPSGFWLPWAGELDLRQAIQRLFRDLAKGGYVVYRSFLRKQVPRGNPYPELRRQGARAFVSKGGRLGAIIGVDC